MAKLDYTLDVKNFLVYKLYFQFKETTILGLDFILDLIINLISQFNQKVYILIIILRIKIIIMITPKYMDLILRLIAIQI